MDRKKDYIPDVSGKSSALHCILARMKICTQLCCTSRRGTSRTPALLLYKYAFAGSPIFASIGGRLQVHSFEFSAIRLRCHARTWYEIGRSTFASPAAAPASPYSDGSAPRAGSAGSRIRCYYLSFHFCIYRLPDPLSTVHCSSVPTSFK